MCGANTGGGGSGVMEYQTISLTHLVTLVTVSVGESGASTSVTINGESIIAAAGGRGSTSCGGDGYSGGGGVGGCGGGRRGADGECYNNGSGLGQSVNTFSFDNFVLTAGDGGEFFYSGVHYHGGGGGGVLINGDGPEGGHAGEGYGGGGGGCDDSNNGVVIMEITP